MSMTEVMIETVAGTREKYHYNEKTKLFSLKKILPQGMVFPYDFGFVPDTLADDGDPADALVLSEFKTFPGCMISCRLIGVMMADQKEKGKKSAQRNDRFLFIPEVSEIYKDILSVEDVSTEVLTQLASFFINYNQLEAKTFTLLGYGKPKKAKQLLEATYERGST